MKTATIPKVKVKLTDSPFGDNFFGYQFALCTKDLQQATSFDSCREGLVHEVVEYYNESPYASKQFYKGQTRLLVAKQMDYYAVIEESQKEFRKAIMRGLRLVHHFEKVAKWPLCRLYEVERAFDEALFLFKADRRWQRSPHMLSLFALLIRLGQRPEFSRFRTHAEFVKICIELSKKKRGPDAYNLKSEDHDLQFIKPKIYLKLRRLMKHFDKIFGKRSAKYFFTQCVDSDYYYQGDGIEDFCYDCGEDEKTAKRFADICRRYAA